MQDFTIDMCNNLVLDKQYYLTDKRDEKIYSVARLKMNSAGTETKCWMTQNLALVLNSNTTLTNELTDLNSVTSWKPVRSTIATGNLNTTTWKDDYNTPYSYDSGRTDYGVYYNWSAAVASNNTSSMTAQYTNAPDSICPKGWRLPMAYNGSSTNMPNEFGNLLYYYNIVTSTASEAVSWAVNGPINIEKEPLNIIWNGSIDTGAMSSREDGFYHMANVADLMEGKYRANYLSFNSIIVWIYDRAPRSRGAGIRCILR